MKGAKRHFYNPIKHLRLTLLFATLHKSFCWLANFAKNLYRRSLAGFSTQLCNIIYNFEHLFSFWVEVSIIAFNFQNNVTSVINDSIPTNSDSMNVPMLKTKQKNKNNKEDFNTKTILYFPFSNAKICEETNESCR